MQIPTTTGRPLLIEMIRTAARNPGDEKLKNQIDQEMIRQDDNRLLDIRLANEWIAGQCDKPRPKMLFGDLWLEGELCILFADTNMGKSILAVQLADSIGNHRHISGFELDAPASPVLYIDFELSSKQFQTRYSDHRGSYDFGPNFYRAEVSLQAQTPPGYATFGDYMAYSLHRALKNTDAKVLIIDNITCLGGSTEQSGRALSLMKQLKMLKTRHQISILVLAHTPKRAAGRPIGRNDLGGSKMLINFADSAIAMAESGTMPGHRYLKQVKQRSGGEKYGANNVCLFKLEKKGSNLQFHLVDTVPEYLHLRKPDEHERERLVQQVISLRAQGQSQRQIAAQMRLSLGKVNKLVSEGEAGPVS